MHVEFLRVMLYTLCVNATRAQACLSLHNHLSNT